MPCCCCCYSIVSWDRTKRTCVCSWRTNHYDQHLIFYAHRDYYLISRNRQKLPTKNSSLQKLRHYNWHRYFHVYYRKRGRSADPFRNNSKRKTSRIDNWHQEKKENACLTRERTLSYTWRNRSTMMMINERERERAERSSRKRYYAKDNLLSKYYFRLYAFEKREKGKDQLNAGKISRGSARIIKAMFI